MRTFILTIYHRRFERTSILTAELRDDRRAREFAATRLKQDPEIEMISISEGERDVGLVERSKGRHAAPS
ncbi:MAG TPA: hypothetical protein VII63_04625 [Caulobacteraceae bacterium]